MYMYIYILCIYICTYICIYIYYVYIYIHTCRSLLLLARLENFPKVRCILFVYVTFGSELTFENCVIAYTTFDKANLDLLQLGFIFLNHLPQPPPPRQSRGFQAASRLDM